MESGDYTAMLKQHLGVPDFFTLSSEHNFPSSPLSGLGVGVQDVVACSTRKPVAKGTSFIPRKSATKMSLTTLPTNSNLNRSSSAGDAMATRSQQPTVEPEAVSAVPKPSHGMRADTLSEPDSIERSLYECPSPVLAGKIQHRFEEAYSSNDRQFSPVIPALQQKKELKEQSTRDAGKDRCSQVLQVVNSNLPPVHTRIPSRLTVRASKASSDHTDDSDALSNTTTGISFDAHEGSDSGTPTAFGQCLKPASALGGNGVAGIQLLTPIGGGPDAPEDVQQGPLGQHLEGCQQQAATQPELHPLFQQASPISTHIPVFHLPGPKGTATRGQGQKIDTADTMKSPHVTITAPSLFVVEQERLSDPMPVHDPRKLLQIDSCEQLIGTPPYSKLMRHLNGDDQHSLHKEPSLFVKKLSPAAAADSPAPVPDAQPSLASTGTPDGRNFGDLLSAINAHQYHSPAPAMIAHLVDVGGTQPAHSSQVISTSPVADVIVGAEDVQVESPEKLHTDFVSVCACKDAGSDSSHNSVPNVFSMAVVEEAGVKLVELPATKDSAGNATSPARAVVAEQSSFHTAGFLSVMTPNDDQSTPFFSPEGTPGSQLALTECESLVRTLSGASVHSSPASSHAHIDVDLHVTQQSIAGGCDTSFVTLSFHVKTTATQELMFASFSPDSESLSLPNSQLCTSSGALEQHQAPTDNKTDATTAAEEPPATATTCSWLQGEGSPMSMSLVDNVLCSPVPFCADPDMGFSDAGFSFKLSPNSACKESVASVEFGDLQAPSPVMLDDDQVSLCQFGSVPGDQDRVNMLSPTNLDSPAKAMSPEPRGRGSALSVGKQMLSPAMAHVEACKMFSKKKESLQQSYQTLDMPQNSDINLPSDLDTPQCSRMVRDMLRDVEDGLRDGECDGSACTETYSQWVSKAGIMNHLTPSGRMDAALQSLFHKAQKSDEAQKAAELMEIMEMEHNAQHNMECAALQKEQVKLTQENESLRQEKEKHELARIQVEKENVSLLREKAHFQARLQEALHRQDAQLAATPTVHNVDAIAPNSTVTFCTETPVNSDRSIVEVVDCVKELERHVVIVCQRSQQQDASGGSFEKTVSYLQQLDKKLQAGKVPKTYVVTDTLKHLKNRVRWAQESLPELIGEFDGAQNEVSRRSMDLAKMKELGREAQDQQASAVGELEEHLKYVGVSMRTHLHSIFVEVNKWPGYIQRLLTHKAAKELQEEQAGQDVDTMTKVEPLEELLLATEEECVPLSQQLLIAADRVVNIMDSISIDCQKLVTPQSAQGLGTPKCEVLTASPPLRTFGAAKEMSTSMVAASGVSISGLTPPPQCLLHDHQDELSDDDNRIRDIQINPLFTDEEMECKSACDTDLQMGCAELGRSPSMPVCFAPIAAVECELRSCILQDSVLGSDDATRAPVMQCSVSVQTSPMQAAHSPCQGNTDGCDTSPESCGGCNVNIHRRTRDEDTAGRIQFLCQALEVKVTPFFSKARRGGNGCNE